ncbi:MAG TPA: hypothetical protein VJN67_01120 [Stellaceae bacterium]|nr:hypothetical protein [Stellaceae bacterium]
MMVDWARLALGAEVGLGIGALILVVWVATHWLLRGRPGGISWVQVAIALAIVTASTGAYAVFSYHHQPESKTAAAEPATAPSSAVPSPDGAAPSTEQALAMPPARPAHAQVDAGGIVLKFDPPDGYCLYPTDLMSVVLAVHKRTNRDNVVHTAFGDCDQLKSHGDTGARIRDFGLVMTPVTMVGKPVTRASLDDFARSAVDPAQVKESVGQRLHEAVARLDMQSFSSVGVLDRDDSSIYLGFLSKLQSGDETFTQACVMALTAVHGRLVSLYLYSDYTKNPRNTLQALLIKTKASVGAFAGLNK